MTLPPGYDAWRLAGPDDARAGIGAEDGQPCNRVSEPDEDAPRGCRPWRCTGAMTLEDGEDAPICDTCGARP